MTTLRGPHAFAGFVAFFWSSAGSSVPWHETCMEGSFGSERLKKSSHSEHESVNFFCGRAKPVSLWRELPARRVDVTDEEAGSISGSIHGAGRYGHRKRTHVRAACGVARRLAGVGNHSTHGHFGRFVVGRFVSPGIFISRVVLQPACEAMLQQGRLPSGSRLPAALTTSVVSSVRTPAIANRAFRATRPTGPEAIRAASVPSAPAGMSCGRERRTQPSPRTRLRPGERT
jgi:hypothetical protein